MHFNTLNMKKIFTFTTFAALILSTSAFSATRTTVQSGDFTTAATWDCNCIPAAGDVVRLEDGDTLTISTSVTVLEFRYRYGENSNDPSLLIVDGTLTITGDFRFDEPDFGDATATVQINGSGTIDVGDEFRLLASLNENNLTFDITVDGSLIIGTTFQHFTGTGSSGNIVNLTVNGLLDLNGNLTSSFDAANSEFNLDCSGDFDANSVSIEFDGNNSLYNGIYRASSDIDFSGLTITQNGNQSVISHEGLTGSDFQVNGNMNNVLSSTSDNSSLLFDLSDNFRGRRVQNFCQGSEDSSSVVIRNNGLLSSISNNTRFNYNGAEGKFNLEILSGGILRSTNSTLGFNIGNDWVVEMDISGAMISASTLSIDMANNVDLDFNIGSTGSVTATNLPHTMNQDCNYTLENDGELSLTGDLDVLALQNDVAILNFNGSTTLGGRLFMSTNGDNSSVISNVADSLICGQLRMDVLTTADTEDNLMNLSSGAVLSVTSINMDNGVDDATIASTENGTSTTVFRGTTTTDLPIRNTVDYDNLIISNTSGSGVTLDEGDLDTTNFHGSLTVTTGARFTVNLANTVNVQGDLLNTGTYDDNGTDLNVDGDFTNSFVFNNAGSDYTIGGNFLNSGTFNTNTGSSSMTVAGNFTNSGTFDAEFGTLDVEGDFSNTANYTPAGTNHDIFVAGDWNNTGSYSYLDGDVVTLDGTVLQALTGNTKFYDLTIDNTFGGTAVSITGGHDSIQNKLQIDDGLFQTNGSLTLLSNSSGTAMLADLTGGGSISGNVTVQRYLDEGFGWYMLGSPVTGSTLADWNNELPMSGFAGSDEPANPWVSVYNYDESSRPNDGSFVIGVSDSGYVEATNTTQSISPGQGWFVYIQNVKPGVTPQTMNSVGPLKTGSQSLTIEYSTLHNLNAENGWNMIANPYASPVDWSLVTKAGSSLQNSNACMRLDASGNYQAVPNTSGNRIYSHEGVWVQAQGTPFTDPGANMTKTITNAITFNEADKVEEADGYNLRSGPNPYDIPLNMVLTYAGNSTYNDSSQIRLHSNASVYYDVDHDARKLENAYGIYPNIASTTIADTNKEKLLWNTLPASDTNIIIPIKVWKRFPANKMENYKIDFHGIKDWTKNNRCLILRDSLNNLTEKLGFNITDYNWSMSDTVTQPKIFLDYSTPLDYSSNNVSCFGYNDGSASIEGSGNGLHDYIWTDLNNNILKNEKDLSGPSTMNNLAPGEYVVYVTDNGECGDIAATIEISEPDPVIADFSSDVDSVWLNTNSNVYFSNGSINADTYLWDFGDGNTSTDENPAHTYSEGGIFEVRMIAITGACSDTLKKTVVVFDNIGIADNNNDLKNPIDIYQLQNETYVDLNFSDARDVAIDMFDVLGRSMIQQVRLSDVTTRRVKLDVPDNIFGVHTIRVIAGNEKAAKKIYYTRR